MADVKNLEQQQTKNKLEKSDQPTQQRQCQTAVTHTMDAVWTAEYTKALRLHQRVVHEWSKQGGVNVDAVPFIHNSILPYDTKLFHLANYVKLFRQELTRGQLKMLRRLSPNWYLLVERDCGLTRNMRKQIAEGTEGAMEAAMSLLDMAQKQGESIDWIV